MFFTVCFHYWSLHFFSLALIRFSQLVKHGQYLISPGLFLWFIETWCNFVWKKIFVKGCLGLFSGGPEHGFLWAFQHTAFCVLAWLSGTCGLSLQAKYNSLFCNNSQVACSWTVTTCILELFPKELAMLNNFCDLSSFPHQVFICTFFADAF